MFYSGDYIAKTKDLDPALDSLVTGSYNFVLAYNLETLEELKTYIFNYQFNPPTGSYEELVSIISGSSPDGIEIFFDTYGNFNNLNNTNNISKLPYVYSNNSKIEDLSYNTSVSLDMLSETNAIETSNNLSIAVTDCYNTSDLVVGQNTSLPVSSLDTFESRLTINNIEITKTNTIKETVYIEPPSTPQPPREYVYKVKAIITDLNTNSQYPAIVYYKDITKIPSNIKIISMPIRIIKTSTMTIVDVS